MEKPNGEKILKILIELYAKQEGVKISYEIEKGEKSDEAHGG